MRIKLLTILGLIVLLTGCDPPQNVHAVACNVPELITAINDFNNTPSTIDHIILAENCIYELTAADNSDSLGSNGLPKIVSPIMIIGRGATIQRSTAPRTPQFRFFKIETAGSLELENTTLSNGEASPSSETGIPFGGAIQSAGTLSITHSTITGNQAAGSGGAIRNFLGVVTISRSTFSDNLAIQGGAIDNSGGDLSVSDSEFVNNQAIIGFQSGQGGAIRSDGVQLGGATVSINGCTFSGNQAHGGGAIANAQNGTMEIYDSSFFDNEAMRGGAISNLYRMTIRRTTIANNAARNGGGIYNSVGPDYLWLINTTISGKTFNGVPQAQDHGSAIYHESGSIYISFTTITNNSGPSGKPAVYVENGIGGVFRYSIIANNPGGDCGYSSSNIPVSGKNMDSDGSCTGFTINADPLLQPLADNGGPTMTHALDVGSPAMDVANPNNCYPTDQRGISRPQGPLCDLGSYEYESGFQGPIIILTPFRLTQIPDLNTPTPTSFLEPFGEIPDLSLCWFGPGSSYEVVSSLQPGTQVEVLGTGETPGYLVVNNPRYGVPCWVEEEDVETGDLDLSRLPVFKTPPLPTKTPPAPELGCLVPQGVGAAPKCEFPCPDPKKYPDTCQP